MKMRVLLCSVIALLLAMPVLAQQGGGQGPGSGGRMPMTPEERLKRMTEDLNLTKDQQAKIKPILEDQQKKMEEMRASGSSDREAMMKLRTETNDKIKAVLNDEQKKKFEEMSQRRGPGSGLGGGGRPPAEKPPQQ